MSLVDQYKKFDFDNNKDFQQLLKELYPPVSNKKAMEFLKRHWYERYVNERFYTNFDGTMPDLDNYDENYNKDNLNKYRNRVDINNGSNNQQRELSGFKTNLKRRAYKLENYSKMMFLIAVYIMQSQAQYLSLLICILAIIRQLKSPRFNKQYIQQLAENQFGLNLLYMLVFSFYSEQRTIAYFFPLMIHYWIGICEFLNIMKNSLYRKAENIINKTRQSQERLLLLRSQIEILILPFLLFQLLFGKGSFFLVLFYYNFIKFKYAINYYTQKAFSRFNYLFKSAANAPGIPVFVGKGYSKIENFFRLLVNKDLSKKSPPTNKNTSPVQNLSPLDNQNTQNSEQQQQEDDSKKSQ